MAARRHALFCALLAAASLAAPAAAADYVSIVQEATVEAPAEAAWRKVGGWCDIGGWLKTTCEVTSGTPGELGSVRTIAGRVVEVVVARTPLSYTYADPNQPILYHGTVEVRPVDARTSKIVYSLFYDQAPMKPEERAVFRERRQKMFAGVLQTMKAIAEAP